MTATELKIKLAEKVLPRGDTQVTRTEMGDIRWEKVANYELAEKIVNFLITQGVRLEN